MAAVRLYAISQINTRGINPRVYKSLVTDINRRAPELIVNATQWEATEKQLITAPYSEEGLRERSFAFKNGLYSQEFEAAVYQEQLTYFRQQVEIAASLNAIPFLVGGLHEMSLPLYQVIDEKLSLKNGHSFYFDDYHLDSRANIFFAGGFITYGLIHRILKPGDTFCFGANVALLSEFFKLIGKRPIKASDLPNELKQFALDIARMREPLTRKQFDGLKEWYRKTLRALDKGTQKRARGMASSAFFHATTEDDCVYIQTARRLLEIVAFICQGGTIFNLSSGGIMAQNLFWSFDTDISSQANPYESGTFKQGILSQLRQKKVTGLHVMELDQRENMWTPDDVAEIIVKSLASSTPW